MPTRAGPVNQWLNINRSHVHNVCRPTEGTEKTLPHSYSIYGEIDLAMRIPMKNLRSDRPTGSTPLLIVEEVLIITWSPYCCISCPAVRHARGSCSSAMRHRAGCSLCGNPGCLGSWAGCPVTTVTSQLLTVVYRYTTLCSHNGCDSDRKNISQMLARAPSPLVLTAHAAAAVNEHHVTSCEEQQRRHHPFGGG